MPTVRHPRIPKITRRVSAAELPNWLAQGWIGLSVPIPTPEPDSEPAPPTEPDPAPTDAAPRRSNQRRTSGAASEGE